MLDGTKRQWIEGVAEGAARPLVRVGLTPNQVTGLGFILVVANCVLFYWHRNTIWFGLGLGVAFAFDALDGAVARLTGMTSKFGGYFDGVTDRYQEIAVYMTIGLATGWWAAALLALSGSLMVSYNKARAAIEIPIDNHGWPDLMERFERVLFLCCALALDSVLVLPDFLGGRVLFLALIVLGALSHITAVQRFFRARAMLLDKN